YPSQTRTRRVSRSTTAGPYRHRPASRETVYASRSWEPHLSGADERHAALVARGRIRPQAASLDAITRSPCASGHEDRKNIFSPVQKAALQTVPPSAPPDRLPPRAHAGRRLTRRCPPHA